MCCRHGSNSPWEHLVIFDTLAGLPAKWRGHRGLALPEHCACLPRSVPDGDMTSLRTARLHQCVSNRQSRVSLCHPAAPFTPHRVVGTQSSHWQMHWWAFASVAVGQVQLALRFTQNVGAGSRQHNRDSSIVVPACGAPGQTQVSVTGQPASACVSRQRNAQR